jgi:hypothetical protein
VKGSTLIIVLSHEVAWSVSLCKLYRVTVRILQNQDEAAPS